MSYDLITSDNGSHPTTAASCPLKVVLRTIIDSMCANRCRTAHVSSPAAADHIKGTLMLTTAVFVLLAGHPGCHSRDQHDQPDCTSLVDIPPDVQGGLCNWLCLIGGFWTPPQTRPSSPVDMFWDAVGIQTSQVGGFLFIVRCEFRKGGGWRCLARHIEHTTRILLCWCNVADST